MSTKTIENESQAIAHLTESYEFKLDKPEHKAILKTLSEIAEKRITNEPLLAEKSHSNSQKMALIYVLALVVTITFGLWLAHQNHVLDVNKDIKLHQTK